MSRNKVKIIPLNPTIGAEISGLNIGQVISEGAFGLLHEALMKHQVIFFREQELTLKQQKRFARQFGELAIHPGIPGPQGHPEVIPIHADANSDYIAGENWHSDVSCDSEPPMGSVLYMHTVPEAGGDTLFANMNVAYDVLSEPMKAFLDGLTARHSGETFYRGRYFDRGVVDTEKNYPDSNHPVIRRHPVTGKKCIFVNRIFTTRINELTEAESNKLLEMLFAHVTRPEFQVRFNWRPHSIAFWDNRCVQHYAIWDYFPETRSGYRVTIKGERPF